MARKLLHSEVTMVKQSNGQTKSNHCGVTFKPYTAKKLDDHELIDKFRNHPWFSVVDFFEDVIEKISAVEEPEEVLPELEDDLEEEEEEKPLFRKKLLLQKKSSDSDNEE